MMLRKVDNAIRDIMGYGDIQQSSGSAYVRLQRIVLGVLSELNLNVSPDVRSTIACIESDYTIPLPEDCVKVYKVGALLNTGEIRTLGKIKTYKEPTSCDCSGCTGGSVCNQSASEPVATDLTFCSACTFHNFYFNTGMFGELYAVKNDFYENGKWSEEDGKIKLQGGYDVAVGNKMVIEYNSSFNREGLALIPDEQFDLIRTKALYEFYRVSKPGVAQGFFVDFKRYIAMWKEQKTRMTNDDWLAAFQGYQNIP